MIQPTCRGAAIYPATIGLALGLALAPACGGGRDAPSPRPTERPDDAPVARPAAPDGGASVADPRVAAGAKHYTTLCAPCHGADGTGYLADNAPSLVSRTFLESADDAFLAHSIAHGRPGTAMGGYAASLGGPLEDAQIGELVAFLRSRGPAPIVLPPAGAGDPGRGAAVWAQHCQTCHGDRTTRGNAVHLGNSTLLAAASDAFLRYAIVHGRPGTPMEPFAGKLTDAQIDDVVALLRSWAEPPPAPPRPRKPPVSHHGHSHDHGHGHEGATPAPRTGPVVINPKGKHAAFTARDGRYVKVDDARKAIADGRRIVIVDARPASDWLRERIAGAISGPYYELDALDRIPNDGTWVLAYCACPHHLSGIVVDELRKRGYKNVAILDEGINVWKQRGYPMAAGDP